MTEFSVLMSLYKKEKPEYARACFESLLRQTVKANEWVIVEDGPLQEEMYLLLEEYQKQYPGLIKRVRLEQNHGLGYALSKGVPACTYSLIARMDTDDIAKENRFEKQLEMFRTSPELDICGSNIAEFEGNPDNIVASRTVPQSHDEIVKYQKKRDAFNHMTVMYKKEAVLKAGNYKSCPLMEDTYLWARMIMSGARCANIEEDLVFARVGSEMFARRGGWQYFKKYREGRKKVLKTGFISWWEYFTTIAVQFVVALMPKRMRAWLFKKVLHKK